MSTIYLKVKVASLAAEARIIRKLANSIRRRDNPTRLSLHSHRKNEVRIAARSSQIAYGYLRGKTYASMEDNSRTDLDIADILRMIEKYGEGSASDRSNSRAVAEDWLRKAQEAVVANRNKFHRGDDKRAERRRAARERQEARRLTSAPQVAPAE